MRPVCTTPHFSNLLDDCGHALIEGVVQLRERGLDGSIQYRTGVHGDSSHLSSAKNLIVWQIEHIDDQLWDRITADPQENCLTVLDKVQAVPLQPFRGEWEGRRKDNALLANSPALSTIAVSQLSDCPCQKTHLFGHVVKGIERGVDIRYQHLRWQRGEQCLRVGPEIWWDLRTLPDANLRCTPVSIASDDRIIRAYVLEQA